MSFYLILYEVKRRKKIIKWKLFKLKFKLECNYRPTSIYTSLVFWEKNTSIKCLFLLCKILNVEFGLLRNIYIRRNSFLIWLRKFSELEWKNTGLRLNTSKTLTLNTHLVYTFRINFYFTGIFIRINSSLTSACFPQK